MHILTSVTRLAGFPWPRSRVPRAALPARAATPPRPCSLHLSGRLTTSAVAEHAHCRRRVTSRRGRQIHHRLQQEVTVNDGIVDTTAGGAENRVYSRSYLRVYLNTISATRATVDNTNIKLQIQPHHYQVWELQRLLRHQQQHHQQQHHQQQEHHQQRHHQQHHHQQRHH